MDCLISSESGLKVMKDALVYIEEQRSKYAAQYGADKAIPAVYWGERLDQFGTIISSGIYLGFYSEPSQELGAEKIGNYTIVNGIEPKIFAARRDEILCLKGDNLILTVVDC